MPLHLSLAVVAKVPEWDEGRREHLCFMIQYYLVLPRHHRGNGPAEVMVTEPLGNDGQVHMWTRPQEAMQVGIETSNGTDLVNALACEEWEIVRTATTVKQGLTKQKPLQSHGPHQLLQSQLVAPCLQE